LSFFRVPTSVSLCLSWLTTHRLPCALPTRSFPHESSRDVLLSSFVLLVQPSNMFAYPPLSVHGTSDVSATRADTDIGSSLQVRVPGGCCHHGGVFPSVFPCRVPCVHSLSLAPTRIKGEYVFYCQKSQLLTIFLTSTITARVRATTTLSLT
jgi:hypothetical protein